MQYVNCHYISPNMHRQIGRIPTFLRMSGLVTRSQRAALARRPEFEDCMYYLTKRGDVPDEFTSESFAASTIHFLARGNKRDAVSVLHPRARL
jgi:hypothetical protein